MNAQEIVVYPDKILQSVCAPVEDFDGQLEQLIGELFATLDALDEGSGIGLSAPQIGVSKRVSVVRVPGDRYGPVAYVNPVVRAKSAYGPGAGKLPVGSRVYPAMSSGPPESALKLSTPAAIVSPLRCKACTAVCLLHEIDHLDGKLFIDRWTRIRRWWVKRKLDKQAAPAGA